MSNAEIDELAHAVAGAGGGALAMLVTYPLVTLSTLAQTTRKTKAAKQAEQDTDAGAATWTKRVRTSSTATAAAAVLREKGLLGFYSGLESALYGITLTNFIYYYFYEFTSNVFLKANRARDPRRRGLSTLQSMVTGAIAGALTCVGSNPFWVANTRTMTKKKQGKATSTLRTLVEIVETDGVGTLFAGVLPALVLVINPIIQYTLFEQCKNAIIAQHGAAAFTAIKAFFLGAFGKLIATFLTYPYITLKSRMHVRSKNGETLTMTQEIKKILREEGVDGLYGGLSIKLFQSITTAAFLFYFKEELLHGSNTLVTFLKMKRLRKSI